ncbi:MAG: ion transporter [Candidatus Paceibacteria bacterium]
MPWNDPETAISYLVTTHLLFITLVSVSAVVLETVPQLTYLESWLNLVEYITVGIFTTEYLIRIYGNKNKFKYIFSFFGVIDLLAILPTFLGLTNLTFLKTARVARLIRVLRTLRLIKVARFSDKKEASRAVLGINFEIYFVLLMIALVILGTLFYTFESANNAPSALHGMYWAFQVVIGERYYLPPDTTGGTVTMILTRLTALIFLGLTIGIVGAILRQKLTGSAKDVE